MQLFGKIRQQAKGRLSRDKEAVYRSQLTKAKALKKQGITGWDAILQMVQDDELERNATTTQSEAHYNRVELAFDNLDEESKAALLALAGFYAQKRHIAKQDFSNLNTPLRDYTQDERACIGSAVQVMSRVRSAFGRNLKSYEFHPQGSDWIRQAGLR